jgi:diguanylate cyclase (GGDEF)-like protein
MSAVGESNGLRVILVGRTGLDAKLRLDAGLELVRVRSALEAVGELADPIDADEPGHSVVIVAPDADPAGPAHTDAARAREFTGALRLVDPQVRVLRLETGDGTAPSRGGYDGIVHPEVSAELLRAAVRGEGLPAGAPAVRPPAPQPSAAPERPPPGEAAPTMPAEAPAPPGLGSVAAGEPGDEPVVRALLNGRDIVEPALALIHQRLAGREVMFVGPGESPAAAAGEAVVGWRGRAFGRLRSPTASGAELAAHAAWLAAWMALRDQQARLRDSAFTDSLTGAFNRRYFDHFIHVAIAQATARRQSLTVLVFDIDDFKQFNDRHGHAAGDEILRETVRLMKSVIRPSDKVCRLGGDEFVVVFHEPDGPRSPASRPPTSVFQIARRFQDAIAAHKFPKLGREAPEALCVSGGLATYPWDGRSPEELLTRADELALQSKKTGKNCITLGPGAERERDGGGETS